MVVSKMKKPTLNKYLKDLKATDRAILCSVLNEKYPGVHQGMLAFIPVEDAATALHFRACQALSAKGTYVRLMSKIESYKHVKFGTEAHFRRWLNPVKISKRLGQNVAKGVAIPLAMPKKIERKRQMFERKCDAYDYIRPVVKLVQIGTGKFKVPQAFDVVCEERYRNHVDQWLMDNVS